MADKLFQKKEKTIKSERKRDYGKDQRKKRKTF
jgi:hypothetical protein